MIRKKYLVVILFVAAVFAVIATGMKSPVLGTDFEKLTKEEATKRWQTSGHADESAEAFRHWDEDDPAVVSTSCAKCHSTEGFVDFIADGTVDAAPSAEENVGIECSVCHSNSDTGTLRNHTSVTFPSGILVENLGPEAICMECHQGRYSTPTVDAYIADRGNGDDVVSSRLSFRNIHYYAAAANQFGTQVKGGYEYAGKTYDWRFAHVDGYNACFTCHDPHSLEVRLDNCATCHSDPANTSYWGGVADPRNIRYLGSCVDYDGDGDKNEGMYYEIQTLTSKLYTAIQQYAKDVAGTPIAYESHTYPYFFKDTNGNGVADSSEANYGNQYRAWTPRLIRAAYNYQCSLKDPGAYAHGGKYMIQILYDSIEDLSTQLGSPELLEGLARSIETDFAEASTQTGRFVDSEAGGLAGMHRGDEGHFDGSSEAWRHWDEDGDVQTSCARCHSATGLAEYLATGTIAEAQPIANGMLCTTCHTSPPALRTVGAVTFPSGAAIDIGDSSNICMVCHQGRASKKTIDDKVASPGPYTFTNIHYYPVAAVLYGTEAKGGYEYEGKLYSGRKQWPNHNGRFETCVQCHMSTLGLCDDCPDDPCSHNVQHPDHDDCVLCHGQDISQPEKGADPTKFHFHKIRPGSTPDYDGDGNKKESIKDEILGLEAALYAQIQEYAASTIGVPIIYDSHSYPYFFKDRNGNGQVDPGEAIYPFRYTDFDANLLKAAYNYQTSKKEPSGYIHNSLYIAQLLVDSIGALGGNTVIYTWR